MKTVRNPEELSELELLGLIPISYSRIDMFLTCPAKYFYRYVLKIEETGPMVHAWLGNIVHGVLEEELKPEVPISPEQVDAYFEQFELQKPIYDANNEIPDNLLDMGKQCIVDFLDKNKGKTYPIAAKEQKFQVVIGRALVTGFIDRVDIDHEKKIVTAVDYKTGSREVAAKNVPTYLQLGIYALALKKQYPDYTMIGELYYLKSGRQKAHVYTDESLDEIENLFIDAVSQIIETNEFKPKTSGLCKYCPYAKPDLCKLGSSLTFKW